MLERERARSHSCFFPFVSFPFAWSLSRRSASGGGGHIALNCRNLGDKGRPRRGADFLVLRPRLGADFRVLPPRRGADFLVLRPRLGADFLVLRQCLGNLA